MIPIICGGCKKNLREVSESIEEHILICKEYKLPENNLKEYLKKNPNTVRYIKDE